MSKTLGEIIKDLGNKSYSTIECRCKYSVVEKMINGEFRESEEIDCLWGRCCYDANTGELEPLDGDSYSLNDGYDEWLEYDNDCLVVWEHFPEPINLGEYE